MRGWKFGDVLPVSARLSYVQVSFPSPSSTRHYLDVALLDPHWISNSYFFDRCLGWSGLCVEPQPRYHEALHRFRSCTFLLTCLTDAKHEGQTVNSLISGGNSGVNSTNKYLSQWKKSGHSFDSMDLRCASLGKELRRYRDRQQQQHITIDYTSLDVEGHELPVLRGIDWSTTRINVITIEVSKSTYPPIAAFMSSIGYKELMKLPDGHFSILMSCSLLRAWYLDVQSNHGSNLEEFCSVPTTRNG